jgi:four helix bundle protein
MNYTDWLKNIPDALSADPLWHVKAYQLALFCAEVGWKDVTKLTQDKRMISLADQLYRSIGSIGANIAEGYSRGSGKDRVRFYEYALGSAREARTWYFDSRHILGSEVVDHRLQLLTEIIRLLLTMVPDQRGHNLRDSVVPYRCNADSLEKLNNTQIEKLLINVPGGDM